MPEMSKLLTDYKITTKDLENIKMAAPIIEENKDKDSRLPLRQALIERRHGAVFQRR